MKKILLTGAPGCSLCTMLENVVKKIGLPYDKVDITEDEEVFARVTADNNRVSACMFVEDHRYIVTRETPAKIPQVRDWLMSVGVEL